MSIGATIPILVVVTVGVFFQECICFALGSSHVLMFCCSAKHVALAVASVRHIVHLRAGQDLLCGR